MNKILNALSIKAYAARTTSADPVQKFNFRLTIPGLPSSIGFQKVSGLTDEVGVAEYAEAGYEYTHKLPGRRKVGEVTAERGVYVDNDLHRLLVDTIRDRYFRDTIILEELNRQGEAVRTYKLAEAWISKWEGSDHDAGSDDVAIEKITIQFERFLDD